MNHKQKIGYTILGAFIMLIGMDWANGLQNLVSLRAMHFLFT